MAAELFKITAGIDVVLARHRADAQVVTDLLGEQVQVAFGGISPVLPHVRANKLRAVGVAGAVRSCFLVSLQPLSDL
jgi:tripartite-type tricarboxylate transporter receptor subunit TctC